MKYRALVPRRDLPQEGRFRVKLHIFGVLLLCTVSYPAFGQGQRCSCSCTDQSTGNTSTQDLGCVQRGNPCLCVSPNPSQISCSAQFTPDNQCPALGNPGNPHPTGPDPLGPHRLSDAECGTSDRSPQGQAVYKIRRSNDHNTCLAFDAGDPEAIPLNNCVTEQKKLFTLIQVPNKCWAIRNGNVNAVPTGRCFHVGEVGDENVGAGICAPTDQQHWKLSQKDGKFLLQNQRGGKCLFSDGGGVSVVVCNPTDENQRWDLIFVRAQ
jgi:Ricin-type beta-trefoil lectin domain